MLVHSDVEVVLLVVSTFILAAKVSYIGQVVFLMRRASILMKLFTGMPQVLKPRVLEPQVLEPPVLLEARTGRS